jgi:large-conductance mechanosensitive channel
MGFNIQSADTTATQKDYTNFVNNFVSNIVNSANLQCNATQNYTVSLGIIPGYKEFPPQTCPFKFTNGTINVTQTLAQTCNLNSENISDISVKITNSITNALKQWIDNHLSSNQGWLAIAFSSQSANNISSQQVATMITNNAITNISNTCAAEINSAQNATIPVCGVFDGATFNFTQAAIVSNLTSCINKTTLNYIATNTQLNSMAQTADNKLASSQEGLTSIFKWIIIAVVIIAVIAGIGILLYFIFGNKSTPKPQEQTKEQEKEMLEHEIMEKKEGLKPGEVSEANIKDEFEKKEAASSPTKFDNFKSLAKKYGSKIGEYANRIE